MDSPLEVAQLHGGVLPMLIYYQLSSAEITVPFSCFLFSSHLLLTNPHCYVISKTKLIVKNDSNSFFRIYHDGKRCAFSEKCVLNKADMEGRDAKFHDFSIPEIISEVS